MDIGKYSADELRFIASQCLSLAADLDKAQPTYRCALAAGIIDDGYDTVRHGWVPSYRGTATITMSDGKMWKAVGHKPKGCPEWISRNGYIEFIPL